jgi:hypothetical protein
MSSDDSILMDCALDHDNQLGMQDLTPANLLAVEAHDSPAPGAYVMLARPTNVEFWLDRHRANENFLFGLAKIRYYSVVEKFDNTISQYASGPPGL